MSEKQRCKWAESDPLLREYHDKEWGRPVRDGRAMWEMLMLEGFQAGLSWLTILRKRDAFRKAFRDFDPAKVARFKEKDIERLLANEGHHPVAREDRGDDCGGAHLSRWRSLRWRRMARVLRRRCGRTWAASRW